MPPPLFYFFTHLNTKNITNISKLNINLFSYKLYTLKNLKKISKHSITQTIKQLNFSNNIKINQFSYNKINS